MRSMAQIAALVGFAVAVVLSIGVAAQTGPVEQTLLQLEREWEQANAKNDLAALERILAPEFVSTDSNGRLMTRAEAFARRKSGQVSSRHLPKTTTKCMSSAIRRLLQAEAQSRALAMVRIGAGRNGGPMSSLAAMVAGRRLRVIRVGLQHLNGQLSNTRMQLRVRRHYSSVVTLRG